MATPTVVSYRALLVPLDGSRRAEAALPHATAIARRFGARLVLFAAVNPPPVLASPIVPGPAPGEVPPGPIIETVELAQEAQEASADYLEGLARSLQTQGLTVETRVDEASENIADSIVAASTTGEIDLIVMTTHGRTGLGRLLFGSVAQSVLRSAPVPVLLIRTGE